MAGRERSQTIELGNPEFGARLAKLRKAAGLSQAELAERLGVTQPLISRYEKGERRMFEDLLALTATALGVTPNELFGIQSISPIESEKAKFSKRLVVRMKQIELLPKRAQDHVMGMLDMALKGAKNSKAS
ncbi:MAG: helix-turn-helix domain-containing protein [Burkholderiaceae bacterium]